MEPACRDAAENPSEANLVRLLDLWSAEWKRRGRTRAVGPGAYERYATLGLFGHGGVVGVSNATGLREACAAVNGFLRSRFPSGTWTSIAVLFNPRMGLHRDIQNMPGHSNHALALGDYTGGRVSPRPGWPTRRGGGSCGVDGWTCTTSPSASMRAATTWWSHTRAACGRSRLMFRKPMLGRRSSTGRRSGRRVFRCRRSGRRRDTQFREGNGTLLGMSHMRITDSEKVALGPAGPLVILSFCHSVIVRLSVIFGHICKGFLKRSHCGEALGV